MAHFPEIMISLCNVLNPGFGYQIKVTDGQNGKVLLFTSRNPVTGGDLLTFKDCLEVAGMYVSQ